MAWNPFFSRRRENFRLAPMQDINEPRREAAQLNKAVGTVVKVADPIKKQVNEAAYKQAKLDSSVALGGIEAEIRAQMSEAVNAGDPAAVTEAFSQYDKLRAEALKDQDDVYAEAFDEQSAAVRARLNQKMITAYQGALAVHSDEELTDKLALAINGVENNDDLGELVAGYAEGVDNAILPRSKKNRRRLEGVAAILEAGAKRDPQGTAIALTEGKYDAYIPRADAMKIARAADDAAFYGMLERNPERLVRLMDERKDIFSSFSPKDRIEYRKKAENQLLERKKFDVAQDKANRAYAELDFFRAPTAAKLDAFDFRGNEKQREKWLSVLESVPNQLASTRIESVSEIASALENLAAMPADTPENREKLFKAAADRMADVFRLNLRGELGEDDMKEYRKSIGEIATNSSLRQHLKNISPVLANFGDLASEWIQSKKAARDGRTFVQRMTENPIKKYGGRENGAKEGSPRRLWDMTGGAIERISADIADTGAKSAQVDDLLKNTMSKVLQKAALGDAAGAEAAYNEGVSRARVTLYPETAGKKKGDLIRKDGIVYTYEGDDGLHPIYKWGK